MPRSVWIFLAVILLPSLVLGWLAVRSVRDQQIILEHQQAIIDQGITDTLAQRIAAEVTQTKDEFIAAAQKLLAAGSPYDLLPHFDSQLRSAWKFADVGFALDLNSGTIFSPQPHDSPAPASKTSTTAATFLAENARFLSNQENAEVYASSNLNANPSTLAQNASPQQTQSLQNFSSLNSLTLPQGAQLSQNSNLQQNAQPLQNANRAPRNVIPAQQTQQGTPPQLSSAAPEESNFRAIVGTETSGVLARIMDNKLRLMVWYRAPSSFVFGAQLRRSALLERFRPALQSIADSSAAASNLGGASWCLALLDDNGKPVALSREGFTADWKHPFVATEVGDALPHWEVALYLTDPGQLGRSARLLQLTLGLIVLVLLAAILSGGFLVAADVRRRTLLAQQKTDFVSNISHELKTPLTSIRLFADLLTGDRVIDPARRAQYLRIISAESSRLTRLINNVLDFARLDRGLASPDLRPCDLAAIAREVTDNLRPHLESQNITLAAEIPNEPVPVLGDRDALAQILLNLLSNAEKYGGKNILLRLLRDHDTARLEVLDRGPGIPPSQASAIFQPFHRLEDSLASGIPGTGLGLSLARQNAQAHRGEITYTPREAGGATFTLTLPLST